MREDPIIYEDWAPSFSNREKFQTITYLDGFLSLVIFGIGIVSGINTDNSANIAFFSVLAGIFLTLEVFSDQYSRGAFSRLVTLFIILSTLLFIPLSLPKDQQIAFIFLVSFVILIKISLIPILLSLNLVYGEMLTPKTEMVREKLEYQLNVLSVTDFAINPQKNVVVRNKILVKSIFNSFVVGVALTPIVFLMATGDQRVQTPVVFSIYITVLLAGILLQTVILSPTIIRIREEEGILNYIKGKFRRKKTSQPKEKTKLPQV